MKNTGQKTLNGIFKDLNKNSKIAERAFVSLCKIGAQANPYVVKELTDYIDYRRGLWDFTATTSRSIRRLNKFAAMVYYLITRKYSYQKMSYLIRFFMEHRYDISKSRSLMAKLLDVASSPLKREILHHIKDES